jgi:hypothetical protein
MIMMGSSYQKGTVSVSQALRWDDTEIRELRPLGLQVPVGEQWFVTHFGLLFYFHFHFHFEPILLAHYDM